MTSSATTSADPTQPPGKKKTRPFKVVDKFFLRIFFRYDTFNDAGYSPDMGHMKYNS